MAMLRNLYATQGLPCREDDPHIKSLCTQRDKKQTSLVTISRSNKKTRTQLFVHSWSCTLDPHIKSQNTKKEKKKLLKEIVDKSRRRKQLHCYFLESHKYLECRASGWKSNANISELSQEQLSLQNY